MLACSSRNASSARCLRPPSGIGPPSDRHLERPEDPELHELMKLPAAIGRKLAGSGCCKVFARPGPQDLPLRTCETGEEACRLDSGCRSWQYLAPWCLPGRCRTRGSCHATRSPGVRRASLPGAGGSHPGARVTSDPLSPSAPGLRPLGTHSGFGSALVGSAPVGNGPSELALDPATHTIYVANGYNDNGPSAGGDTVSVIDARHCHARTSRAARDPGRRSRSGTCPARSPSTSRPTRCT